MEFRSEQKYLLLSPRKIRPVVELIKKLSPVKAVSVLPFTNKKGAEVLAKVIKAAMAQAKLKGVSEAELTFKEVQISEGPRLKRGRPVSRGQWHPIKKRMSHVRVILMTRNDQIPSTKSQINTNDKKSKLEIKNKTKNV